MFACPACPSQNTRLSAEPRIAVVSGGPGANLGPLLNAFKEHRTPVTLINLASRYLPGSDVPVAAHQLTSPDRLRNAVGLAATAARSGTTPVIALPHDPWFTATHTVLEHIRREGIPALHAHVFRPLGDAQREETELVDFGLMYRGAAGADKAAAHLHSKDLFAALSKSKAAPTVEQFLRAALLPTGASGLLPLHTRYPCDLVIGSHAAPKKNAALVLQQLAEAAVPPARAPPSSAPHAAPLSREWLHAAGLRATNLAFAPEMTNPPVHLLTYLSKNFADTGHGKFWIATAEKFGYDYTILGTDSGWPGLGTKINRYYDFLVNSPFADTDIIVVTDADDVVLNVTPSELLQRYEAVRNGKELVVSTEWDHIWPNRIVLPGHETERYPSINVGLFCGTKRALLDIYKWELSSGFNEDQIRFHEYIEANGTDAFTIDYHHELFSCMREDYEADLKVLDSGVLEVAPFHTIPAAVHFPGPMGKSLFAKVQTKMLELGSVQV